MSKTALDKMKNISPWHFVWISIVSSELITLILSVLQGRLWWAGVSRETLIIGAVDSLIVPLIVATVVIYSVKQIAELRRANEQLQEVNLNLQAVDKMKTDFMTAVSHELRTPLTTIKAFLGLIDMKPGMPEQQRAKLMGTINVETDRLMRLITDLLDLARIEDGSLKWRSEELSIEEVVSSSLTSTGPLFESKELRLTTAIGSPLSRLQGDRDRLFQVVTNILSNAAKFTPAGGAVHIAVREEADPVPQIVVEVSDTGIGIPAEDLELIFEKFQRASDHLTSAIEGTGLGLSIARQIVEHHGGRIGAASTRGKGSTFTFTLPLSGKRVQSPP
jgi:signal transduction histidine kinase